MVEAQNTGPMYALVNSYSERWWSERQTSVDTTVVKTSGGTKPEIFPFSTSDMANPRGPCYQPCFGSSYQPCFATRIDCGEAVSGRYQSCSVRGHRPARRLTVILFQDAPSHAPQLTTGRRSLEAVRAAGHLWHMPLQRPFRPQ